MKSYCHLMGYSSQISKLPQELVQNYHMNWYSPSSNSRYIRLSSFRTSFEVIFVNFLAFPSFIMTKNRVQGTTGDFKPQKVHPFFTDVIHATPIGK